MNNEVKVEQAQTKPEVKVIGEQVAAQTANPTAKVEATSTIEARLAKLEAENEQLKKESKTYQQRIQDDADFELEVKKLNLNQANEATLKGFYRMRKDGISAAKFLDDAKKINSEFFVNSPAKPGAVDPLKDAEALKAQAEQLAKDPKTDNSFEKGFIGIPKK